MKRVEYTALEGGLKALLDDLLLLAVTPENHRSAMKLAAALHRTLDSDRARFGAFFKFEARRSMALRAHAAYGGETVIVAIQLPLPRFHFFAAVQSANSPRCLLQ